MVGGEQARKSEWRRFYTQALKKCGPVIFAVFIAASGGRAYGQEFSQLPALVRESNPKYPAQAEAAGVAAEIVLELYVGTEGQVSTATVVSAQLVVPPVEELSFDEELFRREFITSAKAAALELRFSPAKVEGAAVPVRLQYTFHFEPSVPRQEETKPPRLSMRGKVLEAGSRRGLGGLTVVVEGPGGGFEVVTHEGGDFEFYDLEPGGWQFFVDAPGYQPYQRSLDLRDEVIELDCYLRSVASNPFDVTVKKRRRPREVTQRALSGAEAAQVAGTLGDPILAIENLPGVARSGAGSGQAIRGSAPQDTQYYVEGLGTLATNHVGGLRTILPGHLIERVDFYPGNFSVRYGRGTGGVIDSKLKDLDSDSLRANIDISVLDAALYVEAPLGSEAAVVVAGRRSYIDAIIEAVAADGEGSQFVSAPQWWDYQAILEWRLGDEHNLRLIGFGGFDKLELQFDSGADLSLLATSDVVRADRNYQRVGVQYRYRSDKGLSNDLRVGFGRDRGVSSALGRSNLDFEIFQLVIRDELHWRLHPSFTITAGIDSILESTHFDAASIRPPKEGQGPGAGDLDGAFLEANGVRDNALLAAFLEAEWALFSGVVLIPGLRVDYFSILQELTFDPRLVLRVSPSEEWTFTAGAGLVHQQPTLDELVAPFGNPELRTIRALHASTGITWKPSETFSSDVSLFYKRLDRLVSPVSDGAIFRSGGKGQVYGAELMVRGQWANRLSGWISYTLSRAERDDLERPTTRLFDFDQTHILTLVGRYELGRNWSAGLRWRFVTGTPFTPAVDGIFLEAEDSYEPVLGDINSDRIGAFHALDLRLDKTWVFDRWRMTAYLSVTNAYNRANPEGVEYAFDYRSREVVRGLPLLPILGLSVDL